MMTVQDNCIAHEKSPYCTCIVGFMGYISATRHRNVTIDGGRVAAQLRDAHRLRTSKTGRSPISESGAWKAPGSNDFQRACHDTDPTDHIMKSPDHIRRFYASVRWA